MCESEKKIKLVYEDKSSHLDTLKEFEEAKTVKAVREVASLRDANVYYFFSKYFNFKGILSTLLESIQDSVNSWEKTLGTEITDELTHNVVKELILNKHVKSTFGNLGEQVEVFDKELPPEICKQTEFYQKVGDIREIINFSGIHNNISILFQENYNLKGIVIVGTQKMIFYPFISSDEKTEWLPVPPRIKRQMAFGY